MLLGFSDVGGVVYFKNHRILTLQTSFLLSFVMSEVCIVKWKDWHLKMALMFLLEELVLFSLDKLLQFACFDYLESHVQTLSREFLLKSLFLLLSR